MEAAEIENLDKKEKKNLVDLTNGEKSLPHLIWDRNKSTVSFSFIGEPFREDLEIGRKFYSAVEIDGTEYHVGDFCIVRPDTEYKGESRYSEV